MIAQSGSVITNSIEGSDDRMAVAFFHATLIGDVIAHRIALQKISIIDEQRICRLGTNLIDDRSGPRQPDSIARFVRIVIVWEHVNMDVSGFHDPQMRLIVGRRRRKGMQGDGSSAGGRSGKKLTARNQTTIGIGHKAPLRFVDRRVFWMLFTTRV